MPCNLRAGVSLLSATAAAFIVIAATATTAVIAGTSFSALSADFNCQQNQNGGCDYPNQYFLYFSPYHIRFPILYVRNATIQATHVLYMIEKRAYFQLPASCAMVAMVPMHGK